MLKVLVILVRMIVDRGKDNVDLELVTIDRYDNDVEREDYVDEKR